MHLLVNYWLLEPEVDGDINLSPAQFSQLDKPSENRKDALSLLAEPLNLAPGILLCAIDDFEHIDFVKGKAMRHHILAVLKKRNDLANQKGVIINTLFTTAHSSGTLNNCLEQMRGYPVMNRDAKVMGKLV
ncbi:hypothetical protein OCU04_003291 [Sclerotinia nivalis]|uniref:Uncharacterized protein n=1 Tax=Sclerotinia nivalis TaxID=352851 RepID=A0A9X0ARL5_9HELO|nr:hypothetical protein OCU04_003291 [Sclerotinia nivalis]